MTIADHIKRAFPYLLLGLYGIFTCSYFIFPEYSDPYRFFARVVFVFGIFIFFSAMKRYHREPLFLALFSYMLFLLLSGFWSEPFDWFLLGQRVTISVYILCFIAITYYLILWNRGLYERMLQLCIMVAAVAAVTSLVVFYRDHDFPTQRLIALGSLTNINEFANVYGIFAILAMGFALRASRWQHQLPFLAAIAAFICVAWFGQSRTAFASMLMALIAMAGLMLKQRRAWYAAILAALTGALMLLFPDVVEQAMLRGQGLRPMIWAAAWEEALAVPLIGHGLISPIAIQVDRHGFETLHNGYLQVFWQAGLIGLLLFLSVFVLALRAAWVWGSQQRDFTVFCLLLFAACTMMTGVDTLIARPRDQWMLFWFPVALLLAYRGLNPRTGLADKPLAATDNDASFGTPR